MSLEIRPAQAGEMAEFSHVAGTALVSSEEGLSQIPPELTLCAFEDGKLATTYAAFPGTMSFDGNDCPVAGVITVGTLPIYRRRGYLRQITTAHFELLHERGELPIAVLWPSLAAIYQRYDYAIVTTDNSYHVAPRYLEFTVAQSTTGSFREAADDEFGLLEELYESFRAQRTAYAQRMPQLWQGNALAPPPKGGLLRKVIYEEQGKPLGYLIYTLEPYSGPLPGYDGTRWDKVGNRLSIRDLIWAKPSAYRAIWDYLGRMDIISSIYWRRVPPDDPLPHLLLEPRMLSLTSREGLMARIVDVEQALPQRRYTVEGTLTFEVLDEMCPWNHHRWQLETTALEASVRRTDAAPQLRMPVSTLALILFNQVSASQAARMGRLDVLKPDSLSLWDRVMQTAYRPFCPDHF